MTITSEGGSDTAFTIISLFAMVIGWFVMTRWIWIILKNLVIYAVKKFTKV